MAATGLWMHVRFAGVAYTPCNPDIVFSEINYNSSLLKDAGDWVELHNTTEQQSTEWLYIEGQ